MYFGFDGKISIFFSTSKHKIACVWFQLWKRLRVSGTLPLLDGKLSRFAFKNVQCAILCWRFWIEMLFFNKIRKCTEKLLTSAEQWINKLRNMNTRFSGAQGKWELFTVHLIKASAVRMQYATERCYQCGVYQSYKGEICHAKVPKSIDAMINFSNNYN